MLGIDSMAVVFNVDYKNEGRDRDGILGRYYVHDLRIPASLEFRREEIKQLIREGLEEEANFNPFEDGGTADNPNTTARTNFLSFNVEFK